MIREKGQNKFTHSDLVKIGERWLRNNTSCGVVLTELKTTNTFEIPDIIGFGSHQLSILVEVKASRSDFLKDKEKEVRKEPHKGMGKQRYYLCPKDMIKIEELPEGWGLIYVNEKGKARCVHKKKGNIAERHRPEFTQNLKAEWSLMYSVMRRLEIKGYLKEIYDNRKDYLDS